MWLSHFTSSTMWYYTNLTIYELSCKCLMQLNTNSSHKPGTYLPFFYYFNVLFHGIQDGFVFSFRKKKSVFYF